MDSRQYKLWIRRFLLVCILAFIITIPFYICYKIGRYVEKQNQNPKSEIVLSNDTRKKMVNTGVVEI